jgi:acyl carrier protein
VSSSKVVGLLAEALEVEPSVLAFDAKIANIQDWNSLAWLTIISLLDERYSVRLNSKEIRSCVTVQDAVNVILASGAIWQN